MDVIFLYESKGGTEYRRPQRRGGDSTSNQHFFDQLGQRIIKIASRLGPQGRLYEVDARLRPTGRSGPLATPLAELQRYFEEGDGQLWERLALCRARVVVGNPLARQSATEAINAAVYSRPWQAGDADELVAMRARLEESTGRENLKRGPGGIVDIEFITQMLQLRYGQDHQEIRQPNTADALAALHNAQILSDKDYLFLTESYLLLRNVESRIRLMNPTARDDLPVDDDDRTKLAKLLGYADISDLMSDCEKYTRQNRLMFERFFSEAATTTS